MGRTATAALLAGVAACYAPAAREGAPCGPGDACPTGLTCDTGTSRCLRMALADDAEVDAPVDLDAALPAVDAMPPDAGMTGFVDTFTRPDGAAIGNGWIEKTPATFSLTAGEVTRVDSTVSYRDNLVYRPAGENVRDVEVSVRVRFTGLPPRFPQIFVRARTTTITTANAYDGYVLYVDGATAVDRLVLGRQRGTAFVTTLSTITLSEPFTPISRYRFTLRATGTAPVALMARVEKLVGAAWTTIGSTTANDAAGERVVDAGSVGFSGDEESPYIYDEFRRTEL